MPSWPLPPGEPAIYPSTPGGTTAPTLSSWQFSYNGLTFGPSTSVGLLQARGLGALPPVNSQDQAFPRDTGEYIGVDAMGGRDPELDLILTSNIYTQMVSLGSTFAAGGVTEQPLWFKLPGLATMCSMCRPRTRSSDWDTLVSAAGMWTPTLAFHATDPRLYAQAKTLACNASGSSVTMNVTNSGNCETRPVLVLNGPLDAPQIINQQIGPPNPAITFAAGTSIAIGDSVVIDMGTPHTVRYWPGGVGSDPTVAVNVYDWLDQSQTSWWTLLPGLNNILCVNAGSITAGQFNVWSADAYML